MSLSFVLNVERESAEETAQIARTASKSIERIFIDCTDDASRHRTGLVLLLFGNASKFTDLANEFTCRRKRTKFARHPERSAVEGSPHRPQHVEPRLHSLW